MNQSVRPPNNSQDGTPAPKKRKVNLKTVLIIVGVVVVLGIVGMVVTMQEEKKAASPESSAPQVSSADVNSQVPSVPVVVESGSSKAPATNTDFNVDWDVCIAEFVEDLMDTQDFLVDVAVTMKEEQITFSAIVLDSTKPEVALDFADTMLRRFNLFAMMQDSTIETGTKDSYGSLYDVYDVLIGIAPQSQTSNTDKWFVYDAVAKGIHTKQEIKLQKEYRK